MEFVHGVGLDRYLEARGQVGWREVVPLGLAIARGLGAAHARALVHRDVKPGNVLLGHDGGIKIADFGLAQFIGSRSERVGQVFGTPGFLAPEALVGRPYDERCDLFSLGVILYRALSGLYPFPGGSFREVVVATVRRPAPNPDSLAGLAPPALAATVCGLLEKDPERRLGPVGRVIVTLERLVAEEGLAWRLDFARADRPLAAGEIFRSAHLPTLSLPLVGPGER
jgi:serine/threonine-protein kinase